MERPALNKVAIALLLGTLVLLTIGVVMLFSTSAVYARDRYADPYYLLKRQVIWVLIGGACCIVLARTPYPCLRRYAPWVLVGAVTLLVLVLIPPLGVKVGGARRWLALPGMRFQPSEFAKLALVIWLAHWLAREKRRIHRWWRGFLVPMSVTGVVLVLVLVEPDFGSTVLLATVAFALMFIAGVRLRYLVPTMLTGAAGLMVLMVHSPERARRLLAFIDLDKYKQGAGYQVWQAILAFGSGGLSGLGLGSSRQKMFYLPEAHTDFIFPIIGEELGLAGTLAILGCFTLLIVCGVLVSLNAPDPFGQYLGLGIVLLVGTQALINIGVVTAWLPTKGLPLPFISFGGSNLLMSLSCIGLLLSIYRFGAAESLGEEDEFLARRVSLTT
ncbi:putative lipid II flippase FtsW [bacterium]|nr:putative lipid II flippase FtsW [bacterium]